MIVDAVESDELDVAVDVRMFALAFAALLDGLSIQVVLGDPEVDVDVVLHQVRPIVEAVRERGVPAVLEFAERFDRIKPASVRVPQAKVKQALAELDPKVREALEESIARDLVADGEVVSVGVAVGDTCPLDEQG